MACGSSRVEGLLGDEMHKTFGLSGLWQPSARADNMFQLSEP